MNLRISHAKTNGPSRDVDTDLKVVYWNAGGLSNSKFLEYKRSIIAKDADIYVIAEAGAATETPQFYTTNGYSNHILNGSRQVASGMMIGIKTTLVSKTNILHEMQDRDSLEAYKVDAWKGTYHATLIFIYNPPGNIPDLELLDGHIQTNTIIIGDFNSPSRRWGYQRTTNVGRHLEAFIDYISFDVKKTPPTFLSFAGSETRPDLVLTHPHITQKTTVSLMDDAGGCGHRSLLVSCELKKEKQIQNRAPRWNFKKARWTQYQQHTDEVLTGLHLTDKHINYLPRLETVYLYGNQMMSLTPALFKGTSLTTLHLDNNPWHCDCELATFVLWTQETGVRILDHAYCAHPDDLRGLNIKNLTTSLACK